MLNRLIPASIIIGLVAASSASTFSQQEAAKGEEATGKQESKLTEEQEQALNAIRQVAASASACKDRLRGSLIEAQAADLLWAFDEAQARIHFQHALETVGKVEPEQNASEARRSMLQQKIQQARDEILKLLSRHDAKAAEELTKTVRVKQEQKAEPSSKEESQTSAGLLQLAREAAKIDPKKALELGLKSIKGGQFPQDFGILFIELYKQDREAGRQLLLVGIDVLAKPGSDVLSGMRELSGLALAAEVEGVDPALREAALKLLEVFLQRLNETVLMVRQGQFVSRELAQALTQLAQGRFLPFLQALDPARVPEVQQLLSELSARLDARDQKLAVLRSVVAGQYENFDSELIKAEKERDPAIRDLYFRALAVAELKRKQYDNARRAAEKIQELELRIETHDDINLGRAATETLSRNFEEAVRAAQDINDMLLRTRVLIFVAAHATKEQVLTRLLLDKAYLSAQQADTSAEKAQALVVIAEAYAPLDALRAFETYFTATQVMNKVDPSQSVKEKKPRKLLTSISVMVHSGEERLLREQVALEDISFGQGLERIAQDNYNQAMLLATSVKHEILRARMQLGVCRGVLSKKTTGKEGQKQ